MKDNTVTWQVLEGEEEKENLKKIIEAQQEMQSRSSKGRGNVSNALLCVCERPSLTLS